VVQVDADLTVVVALVAERVLDLRDAAVRRRVEVILTHRLSSVAVEVDLIVVEDDLLPAGAARAERKTLVLSESTGNLVAADEVRERALASGAEGILGRLRRLEEHIGAAVAVELVRRPRGLVDVVAAV